MLAGAPWRGAGGHPSQKRAVDRGERAGEGARSRAWGTGGGQTEGAGLAARAVSRQRRSSGRCWEARGRGPRSRGFPSGLARRRAPLPYPHPTPTPAVVSAGEAGHQDGHWSPGRCAPSRLWWLTVHGYQSWLSCAPLPRGGRGTQAWQARRGFQVVGTGESRYGGGAQDSSSSECYHPLACRSPSLGVGCTPRTRPRTPSGDQAWVWKLQAKQARPRWTEAEMG